MRAGAAALAAGLFGALGTLCLLLAFGTDYWLLASDDCGGYRPPELNQDQNQDQNQNQNQDLNQNQNYTQNQNQTLNQNQTESNGTTAEVVEVVTAVAPPSLTLLHEGFFWRCVFQAEPGLHEVLAVLFTNQPETKVCIHGYLFPLPVAVGPVPHPIYDATAVFRGFWTLLIILGVVSVLVGGFLLVCAVPFFSPKLYRLGGAFLLTAACLFLALLVLYVLWAELVDVRKYVLQERGDSCPDARVTVLYGWSFMVAGAAVPLELLAGLLFLLIGRQLASK